MDKQQIKLLKQIKKSILFDYSNLSREEKDILSFLRSNKLVISQPPTIPGGRPLYKISEYGKIALYENKKDIFKTMYPNIASTIAVLISIVSLILSILGII